MVTLKELQQQIKSEKDKEHKEREREELEFEKIKLKRELKVLRRTPAQKRNIKLLTRTGRGLKILGGKARDFTVKQAERIRKQQLRDEAMIRQRNKTVNKKKKKSFKKLNNNLFDNLDF